jgi:hypothetical protein
MKAKHAALIGAALLLGYTALPAGDTKAAAQAAPGTERYLCDTRETVVKELSGQFHEQPIATGLQGNGTLLEVFASRETGSWTVLITMPTGVTCLALAGDSFEMLPPQADGPRV